MSDHPELQDLATMGLEELRDRYIAVGELVDQARRQGEFSELAHWLASREVLEVALDQRLGRDLPF